MTGKIDRDAAGHTFKHTDERVSEKRQRKFENCAFSFSVVLFKYN